MTILFVLLIVTTLFVVTFCIQLFSCIKIFYKVKETYEPIYDCKENKNKFSININKVQFKVGEESFNLNDVLNGKILLNNL